MAPDLINEDYTSDCFFCCFRNTQNPLHTAISYPSGCREIVPLLVEYGGDVNERNSVGRTCVHRAARQNNIEFTKLFMEHGGDLYARDPEGYYPIHSAVLSPLGMQHKNAAALEYIISLGKPEDVELKDNHGATPLHIAAACDFAVAAEVLLKHGADLKAVNDQGRTPKDLAGPAVRRVIQEFEDSQ